MLSRRKKNNGHIKHNYENKGNIVYEYAVSSCRCVYLYSTYNQLKYIFRYKINTCGRDTNIRISIQTHTHTHMDTHFGLLAMSIKHVSMTIKILEVGGENITLKS